MKILLLGKNGQVGGQLQRALAALGEVIALDRHSTGHCGDISNLPGLRQTVLRLRPRVIVNAAAHTGVDSAQREPDLAHTLNARAPEVLAQAARSIGALLVHYSTDYVFDGSGTTPWHEHSPTGPLNVYGHTKLQGEQAICASGCAHLIFRTSWVYAARGHNFIHTILRRAAEQAELKVVADQWGAPTGADLIADITAQAIRQSLIQPQLGGLYHLAPAGQTHWCDYARFVIEQACALQPDTALAACRINAITSAAMPALAPRPLNSRLDTSHLRQAFGLSLPPWQEGVQRVIGQILSKPTSTQSTHD